MHCKSVITSNSSQYVGATIWNKNDGCFFDLVGMCVSVCHSLVRTSLCQIRFLVVCVVCSVLYVIRFVYVGYHVNMLSWIVDGCVWCQGLRGGPWYVDL